METMTPVKLWICLAAVGGVLGTVSILSIRAAPSASSAIIAIRVAHLEVFWAKVAFRDPAVHEAEFHLSEAWSTLKDRRYERSLFSAHAALQRVRDIKGGLPSLYSSKWDLEQRQADDANLKRGCSN